MQNLHYFFLLYMERVTRIELALAAWKAVVLPLNYTRIMVLEAGLEPAWVLPRRILSPVRLPIPPLEHNGAPPETRTRDPFIKSEMLYHWASGTLAGVVRFELTHERVKVFCLTAWLHPNNGGQGRIRTAETRRWLIYSQQRLTASLPVHFK